jgi:hypothetical protein
MNENAHEDIAIGVTGHRHFHDADVSTEIDRRLDEIIGDRRPFVVSSLAEGADRMVAECVLSRPGARLVAVLPLAADDYERDFAGTASIAAFRTLLAHADSVAIPDLGRHATREEAYAAAGLMVVDRCDVLIAVWDGAASRGRGGTAEVVEHARRVGRRVELVSVTREPAQ